MMQTSVNPVFGQNALHFGNATARLAGEAARQLPGMRGVGIGNALKTFDFKESGIATLKQIMVIYGMCILSRMYNAWRRSKNELREEVTRDSMGFGFWFFGTPFLQRAFLKLCAPKAYHQALLELNPKPATANFASLPLKEKARVLNWHLNPLARYALPGTKQINEQMALALKKMKQVGYPEGSAEFAHIKDYYTNLVKWRNYAAGVGYATTIGLIGIGINLYNIYITKKKLQQHSHPPAPMPAATAQPFIQA
jgi:hypothetical protein